MNNFDDMIRAKAKSEPIAFPEGLKERNDLLISELDAHPISSNKNIKIPVFPFELSAAAILIVLLLAGVCSAAYTLSGGNFFKQFFVEKANRDTASNYRYMNTEQLNKMASSTVGTVVNTDEITIDVMGVITSGNTTKIMLKVTANKLDSVLYDTGIEPLNNYRFNDDTRGSLFSNFATASIGYIYSNKDKSLASNQFKILYTLIGTDIFKKGQYTLALKNFGYFTSGSGTVTDFVSIYDKSWQFDIAFDSQSDTSKNVFINKGVTFEGYTFIFNSVKVTPLACTIRLECNQDRHYFNEHSNAISKDFAKGTDDCSVTLANGTIISGDQIEKNVFGGEEGYTVVLTFNVPVTVNDVVSLSLFGTEYAL